MPTTAAETSCSAGPATSQGATGSYRTQKSSSESKTTASVKRKVGASESHAVEKAKNSSLNADENEEVPIILSRAGWASNHSGLMGIVEKHKDAFSKELEYGPCRMPDRSPAVNKVILELAQNYKPKILLETSEEPSSLQHTQLNSQDIVYGGKFHALMAKKVLECFERAKLEASDEILESPLPKAFEISQSPESAIDSPENSVRSVKRVLPTLRTRKQQAATTPVRAGTKRDLSVEKTPVAGNKKLREKIRDVVLPRSASRAASREAKRLMQELPTANRRYVRVDQLAYDWSALDINGSANWNRFLHERNDPRIELEPPVVTAMDTYQLVQSVKSDLATITPPPNSFLYDALAEDYVAEEEGTETPKDRLKILFRKMANYETSETSRRKHEYQLMREDEIQDYLVEIEKDIKELDEIESQLEDDKLDGTDSSHAPSRLPKTNMTGAMKNSPVFWQKNFAALLNNKGPATRYLMAQDQF